MVRSFCRPQTHKARAHGIRFTLALLALVLLSCSSCQGDSDLADGRPGERISLAQAEALVREWIFETNPDMNPAAQFPLLEVTTEEIWQRLDVQVFRLQSDVLGPMTVAIADGRITALGISFGGYGVTDMVVTDLDADGEPELTYTYSWGSGIHRSHLAVFLPKQGPPETVEAEIAYLHGDFLLQKVDDQTVVVQAAAYDSQTGGLNPHERVGQLFLRSDGGEPALAIELDADLPLEIRERIVTP